MELNQLSSKYAKYAKTQKGVIFFAGTKGKRKNPKIHKKPKGYDFLLAQKVKAKTIKRSNRHDLGKKQNLPKKAKMANRPCNGCDNSSVKYGPMCYPAFEV